MSERGQSGPRGNPVPSAGQPPQTHPADVSERSEPYAAAANQPPRAQRAKPRKRSGQNPGGGALAAVQRLLPPRLRQHVLHFEAAISAAVAAFSAALPASSLVLDAGAGEGQYAHHFARHRYIGVDLGIGDHAWDYSSLDAIADLTAIPFADGRFDAAINIVTLEHVCEPARVLTELARVLAPGGRLLLAVPHEWEVHQSPYDFYRYTRHGAAYLLRRAGFDGIEITPVGGYFRLLARRLLNGLQFFSGGLRWIWFLPAAMLLVPPALILPFLDFLDRERNFTLGYICTARKSR